MRQVPTLGMTVGGHDYKTTFLSNTVGYSLKQDKNKPKYSKIQFIIPDCMLALKQKKKKKVFSFYYIMIEVHIILSMVSNLWFQLERTLNFK